MASSAVLIALLVVLSVSPMLAIAATSGDVGFWGAVRFKKNIGRWEAVLGNELRLKDYAGQVDQILIEPGLGYALSTRLRVGGGFGWTPQFNPTRAENRIWEQLDWARENKTFSLVSRTQLEQRFLPGFGTVFRFRQRLRTAFPLAVSAATSFALYDEVLVNLNQVPTTRSGFNQNRLFLGPEFTFTKEVQAEIGLLGLYTRRLTADVASLVLQTGVTIRL